MHDDQFKLILNQQRQFFATGKTLSLDFRLEQLEKLKSLLQIHETEIAEVLRKDLNKAPMEAILNEVLLVITEIDFIMKRLKKWMRPKKVPTPFPALWPGRSEVHYEPYGSVLIMGAWNYPFQLVLSPLIGAICAGNCVVVKPSDVATYTQNMIAQLITDHFSTEYISVVKGGPEVVNHLLQEKFDYIFFTGGTNIGKIILEAAAKQLTPVTLELGGKSPCIVDETADLDYAARRIAWAKTINAGQTCIAPDYLLVHSSRKQALVNKLQDAFKNFFGDDPEKSNSYARIINKKHFERLTKLLQKGNILAGGQNKEQTLYFAPTLIDGVNWDDPIMQEEIFGPILPILTYDKTGEFIQAIKSRPKPLALYLFSKNKETQEKVLDHISFGSSCVNDCIMQLANFNLPFGGVGASGIGRYHGKYSFDTFSHEKSVYKKSYPLDFKLEYPPYTDKKLWWIRKLLRC